MRKTEKLFINYVGYKEPENKDELEFEILGLENAIKNAELRISMLRQGLKLNLLFLNNMLKDGEKKNEKTINSTNNIKENK